MKIDGNDPISPRVSSTSDESGYSVKTSGGLTIRQYFAALAMQGLMARQGWPFDSIAIPAVEIADALIEALNTEAQ